MDEKLQSAVDENPDTAELQSAPPDTSPATETADISAITSERDSLGRQKAELQERYLRLQAEFDNFRKRTERERMDFATYAGEGIVRVLLPILDDFERALKAGAETNTASEEFLKGVELIYKRLLEALKNQGLEPIPAEGEKFDPHQHEAVQRLHSDEHEEGAIVAEYQRGYNFKGRLLRPSMVQVAVKS
jgi:molecular chaperone GrpE